MTHPGPSRSRKALWRYLILIGIVAVGAALRFHRLGYQEIWGDEAVKLDVVQDISRLYAPVYDVHPRLFHTFLFGWYRLFGFNTFGLRMLTALTGVLGIPVVFVLAQRWTKSVHTSVMTAVVLALSPFHVYYSQDLTQYTLMFLLVALSHYQLTLILDRAARWADWAAYVLATVLALHAHYYAAFALVAQNIFVLIFRRPGWRSWGLAQSAMAVLVLPWLYLNVTAHANQLASLSQPLTPDVLMRVGAAFVVGTTCPTLCAPVAAGGWLLMGVALIGWLWPKPQRQIGALAALTLATPIGLVWLLSTRVTYFNERFAMAALPSALILLAWGLTRLPLPRAGQWLAVLPYVLSSGLSLQGLYYDPSYLKSTYGAMLADINRRAQPGDVLLLNGTEQRVLFEIYRPARLDYRFVAPDSVISAERTERDLPRFVEGYQRAWIVMFGPPAVYDPEHRAEQWLSTNGFKTYYQSYLGYYVTLYVLRPNASMLQTLTKAEAHFSEGLQLTGYAYMPREIAAGDTAVLLTLRWTAAAPIGKDYTVFTHLWDVNTGQVVAQVDSEPASGTRPTSSWNPGEVLLDNYALSLPADLPMGDYALLVGLYDWRTGARLPVLSTEGVESGPDYVRLGTIRVSP